MLNFKKKSISTVLATAMLLSSIAIPSVVVYASDYDTNNGKTKDDYAIYADIPGEAAFKQVDDKAANTGVEAPVTTSVWIGGGNSKQSLDVADGKVPVEVTTSGKTVQMYLFNTDANNKTYNITTAKGVLWAVSKHQNQVEVKGGKLVKSDFATVSKGKVTAGKKATSTAESAYVIAYRMKTNEKGQALKFGDKDNNDTTAIEESKLGDMSYEVLAVAKLDVKQAATTLAAFPRANDVKAYEFNTKGKSYNNNAAAVGDVKTDASGSTQFKKLTATTVGIGEQAVIYVSGTAGVAKTAMTNPDVAVGGAIPATEDGNTYTVSIANGKDGTVYAKLMGTNDGSDYDQDAAADGTLTLTQADLENGFAVEGVAVAPTVKKGGTEAKDVTFKPSKATVTITNNQSGKSTKVTVTVTNGAASVTPATEDAVDKIQADYNTAATYTYDLLTGVAGNTTGAKANDVLADFAKVKDNEGTPVLLNNDPATELIEKYKLVGKGPTVTPNKTDKIPVNIPGATTEPKQITDVPVPVLVKPAVAVYYYKDGKTAYDNDNTDAGADGKYTQEELIAKLKADTAAASIAKPAVPKIAKGSTEPYTVATGFKAAIAKDNTTLTLTLPKIGFKDGDNVERDIFVVVSYGGQEANVLVQPITITPKTQGEYEIKLEAAETGVKIKEADTKTKYEIKTLETGKAYAVSFDGLTASKDATTDPTKFQLIAGKNVTIGGTNGDTITLAKHAKNEKNDGNFKIKIGTITYTVSVEGTNAAGSGGGEEDEEKTKTYYLFDFSPAALAGENGGYTFTYNEVAGTGTASISGLTVGSWYVLSTTNQAAGIVKGDDIITAKTGTATNGGDDGEKHKFKVTDAGGGSITIEIESIVYTVTLTGAGA